MRTGLALGLPGLSHAPADPFQPGGITGPPLAGVRRGGSHRSVAGAVRARSGRTRPPRPLRTPPQDQRQARGGGQRKLAGPSALQLRRTGRHDARPATATAVHAYPARPGARPRRRARRRPGPLAPRVGGAGQRPPRRQPALGGRARDALLRVRRGLPGRARAVRLLGRGLPEEERRDRGRRKCDGTRSWFMSAVVTWRCWPRSWRRSPRIRGAPRRPARRRRAGPPGAGRCGRAGPRRPGRRRSRGWRWDAHLLRSVFA